MTRPTTTLHVLMENSCCRSIVPLRVLVEKAFYSSRHNGVVARNGKGNTLMATDALESMGQKLNVGNNIMLSLEAETKDEAERLFKGLSAGGTVTVPLADAAWGAHFGMMTDKFGIQWMVNYTYKK